MGLPIPFYALVVDQELRTTRNNSLFWQAMLKTTEGTIKALMWNAPSDAEQSALFPHKTDIIEVTAFDDQIEERGNIIIPIGGFNRIVKANIPEDQKSICEFAKASDEEIKRALAILEDSTRWNDPINYEFTMNCLGEVDREKWLVCPAAERVHHSYQGGLAVHTSEVVELAMAHAIITKNNPRYHFVNLDIVRAGAILHDLGKVDTYRINDLGVSESMINEKQIGHIFYGMTHIKKVGEQMKMDGNFLDEVLHVVAAHHGNIEWGSIKEVLSIEAGIVAHADYVSSRNGIVESKLTEAVKSGQPLPEYFKIYGDNYYNSIGMRSYFDNATAKQG